MVAAIVTGMGTRRAQALLCRLLDLRCVHTRFCSTAWVCGSEQWWLIGQSVPTKETWRVGPESKLCHDSSVHFMAAFSIVVAADQASGIGLNGGLPWRLRKDMAFFAKVTSTVPATTTHSSNGIQRVNACIMGRRTWESIPVKFRPLANRLNIIVSRDPHYLE